ncbi:hypothetical protein ACFFX0_32655 [Citricoccus parietis]|uniref:Uncharacterized protein n=1 Tax=Citricoccus parietis TaxID=592307 RepID=A0ABV5G9P7_9MICC
MRLPKTCGSIRTDSVVLMLGLLHRPRPGPPGHPRRPAIRPGWPGYTG